MLKNIRNKIREEIHIIYKHLNKKELEILGKSSFFNAKWYENKYGIKSCDAVEHYLKKGCSLGYDPSNEFSTSTYYSINPDTKTMNALLHYEMYGKHEGRRISFIDNNGYKEPGIRFTNYNIYEQTPKKWLLNIVRIHWLA